METSVGKYGPHAKVVEIFSYLAKENSMYIAINLGSKRIIDGVEKHYNTDVVFDRVGRIVARYDKKGINICDIIYKVSRTFS